MKILVYSIFIQIVTIVSCKNLENTIQRISFDDYVRSDAVGDDRSVFVLKVFLLMMTRETSPRRIDLPVSSDEEFDLKKPLVFIIHGFLSSSKEEWVGNLANAYLKQKDVVVFIVDWSSLAELGVWAYPFVVYRLSNVAQVLVDFMKPSIVQGEVDFSRIHIIGHSLGAHVAGIVGKLIPNLNRITGLDPAGPEFETPSPTRLSSSDADYVDVIHTNGEFFGNNNILGQVDFYVNGGNNQPGCDSLIPVRTDICSHGRAIEYFTESIENPQCLFVAASTESEAAQAYTKNFDEQKNTVLGLDTFNYSARGTMFIVTNEDSPFCRVPRSVVRAPPSVERVPTSVERAPISVERSPFSVKKEPPAKRVPPSARNLSILDYLLNIIVDLAKSILDILN